MDPSQSKNYECREKELFCTISFSRHREVPVPTAWTAQEWETLCKAGGGSLATNAEGRAVNALKQVVSSVFDYYDNLEVQVYGSWAEGVALPGFNIEQLFSVFLINSGDLRSGLLAKISISNP